MRAASKVSCWECDIICIPAFHYESSRCKHFTVGFLAGRQLNIFITRIFVFYLTCMCQVLTLFSSSSNLAVAWVHRLLSLLASFRMGAAAQNYSRDFTISVLIPGFSWLAAYAYMWQFARLSVTESGAERLWWLIRTASSSSFVWYTNLWCPLLFQLNVDRHVHCKLLESLAGKTLISGPSELVQILWLDSWVCIEVWKYYSTMRLKQCF